MTRTRLTRAALGLAVLGFAAACTLSISFDQNQDLVVNATGTALETVQAFDLSTQPEVVKYRGNVKSFSFNKATLTLSAVDAANTWTAVTGSVALRPFDATDASQDVAVGNLTGFAITANNAVTLVGNAALDTFVMNTLKGSMKFKLVVKGNAVGGTVGKFTIHAKANFSMEYET